MVVRTVQTPQPGGGRSALLFAGYFFLFSVLMAGVQIALSPAPIAPLTFVPGASERITDEMRDRLRAARALHALDAASTTPSLTSAAQLIVAAVPAERGIPDKFLKVLERVAYSPTLAKIALPLRVTVDYGRTEPRGTYSDATISVAAIDDASEMVKVLVHEMGHRIDVGTFVPGSDGKDLSDDFYALSWTDVSVKRRGAKSADFVSGYAQTNRYEDFAESFVFYIFHNRDFAQRALHSKILKAKYHFFQESVFPERNFQDTAFQVQPLPSYLWDTTKIAVHLPKYLKYVTQ